MMYQHLVLNSEGTRLTIAFFCYDVVRYGERCQGSEEFSGLALMITLYHNSTRHKADQCITFFEGMTCAIDEPVVR